MEFSCGASDCSAIRAGSFEMEMIHEEEIFILTPGWHHTKGRIRVKIEFIDVQTTFF